MLSYDAPDDYFVDVYEAERSGLLPASGKAIRLKARGHVIGMSKASVKHKPVCQSSMTFVLETPDAGLGSTLMMMWTFYGLLLNCAVMLGVLDKIKVVIIIVMEQDRAFFINDSRWAYGTYTDILEAPPAPDCRPPPRHHIVPCPFQARHLAVSVVTAKEIFPALLAKSLRIAETDNGLRDLFELAQTGNRDFAPIIGLHIRHGGQHPLEYQYRDGYIPAEVFLQQVVQLVEAHYNSSAAGGAKPHAITLLASEDPTVHEEPDFSNVILPQERILLASKDGIEEANPNPHMPHHFVDETFGCEGGFFAPMFWNLWYRAQEQRRQCARWRGFRRCERGGETHGASVGGDAEIAEPCR
ncbi:hypothetical protein FALCPG4_015596 [Fusarium falciforme]